MNDVFKPEFERLNTRLTTANNLLHALGKPTILFSKVMPSVKDEIKQDEFEDEMAQRFLEAEK